MKRLQAYLFKIEPNGEQARALRRFAGCCRYVYNRARAWQEARHDQGGKRLGYAGLCKALTDLKAQPDTRWLEEAPSQILQQSLKDLVRAYRNFFEKRAAFPVPRKKGRHEKFRFPQGFKLDQANSRVFLPKLGWIRYRNSRTVLGTVKHITVSVIGGAWHVSIQAEREVEQPVHPATRIVGIDVGIARFATLSDGSHIEPLHAFRKHERRLAKYQRRLSHIKKHSSKEFSNNWKKAKARVQKLHNRIAHVRKDFLHKTTTTISQNHAMVCIEDLQVRNMSRSASGTIETPGHSVKAKSGLNKSILDQGWGEFRRQLEYKQAWLGGEVLVVPPHHTSQTCPACGHVSAENRRTQARFACVDCGHENNADGVGAINILNRGMKMLEGQDTADASAGCASIARIACEVNGAARPSAAGTRRSDPGVA